MMRKLTFYTVFLLMATAFTHVANAKAFVAAQSGSWQSSSTWQSGSVPSVDLGSNTITIPKGITVDFKNDLYINDLFASLNVNGSLTANGNAEITCGLGLVSGEGSIDVHSFIINTFSNVGFTGELKTENFVTRNAEYDLEADLYVNDSLYIGVDYLTILKAGTVHFGSGSKIVCNKGKIDIAGGKMLFDGKVNLVYNGEGFPMGAETDSIQHINSITVNLKNQRDTMYLPIFFIGDFHLQGDLIIQNGFLDIEGESTILSGDIEIQNGGFFSEGEDDTELEIRGVAPKSSPLAFTAGYLNEADLERLTINTDTGSYIEILDSISVDNMELLNGDLHVTGNSELEVWEKFTRQNGELQLNDDATFDAISVTFIYKGNSMNTSDELGEYGSLNTVLLQMRDDEQKLTLHRDLQVYDSLSAETGAIVLDGHKFSLLNGCDVSASGAIDLYAGANAGLELEANMEQVDYLEFKSEEPELGNLWIRFENDSSTLEINKDLRIASGLHLETGIVQTSNDLHLGDTASVYQNHYGSYVKLMNEATFSSMVQPDSTDNFPVGYGEGYTGMEVENQATSNHRFTLGLANGVYRFGNSGYNMAKERKVVNKTWNIESESATAIDANITFYWQSNMEMNGFDRNNAFVSHYTNGAWDNEMSKSAQIVDANLFALTKTNVTSLSPFSVQNEGVTNWSHLQEQSISVYPNPVENHLRINSSQAITQVQIRDVSGKLIGTKTLNQGQTSVDFSQFENGLYHVSLWQDGTKVESQTIVKR